MQLLLTMLKDTGVFQNRPISVHFFKCHRSGGGSAAISMASFH